MPHAAAAFLALLAAPALPQNALHVVDPAGGGDFTDLAEAVEAAESRDMILVRAGRYRGFEVEAKALSIFAEPGALVEIAGGVRVLDLNFAESFLLRGARTPEGGDPSVKPFYFSVAQANGDAWLEDCTLRGPDGAPGAPALPAVRFTSSSNGALVRCRARGGAARLPGAAGAPGVDVQFAIARVLDCRLQGGAGGAASSTQDAGPGGPGLATDRYTLTAAGTVARGGPGGDGSGGPSCRPGGPGGPGLFLTSFLTEAYLLDLELAGGPGGTAGCGDAGPAGADLDPGAALVESWFPAARSTEAPATAESGASATRTFRGLPGDQVFVIESVFGDQQPWPALFGVWFPGFPSQVTFAGTLSGDALEQTFELPPLPAAAEAAVLYQQGAFVGTDGTTLLGSPSATLVLRGERADV